MGNNIWGKLDLGSHVTHVYNATNEDILVRVEGDRLEKSAFGIKMGGAGLNASQKRKLVEVGGFTRIESQKWIKFWPSYENGMAFATIVLENGKMVCENHPVRDNHSLIVDAKGYLRNTMYGKITTDDTGVLHE